MTTLKVHAAADPILKAAAEPLVQATERFVAGFSDLRNVQSAISTAYESQVLERGARDGRPLRHHGERHARAGFADLAVALEVARIVLDHAGADQRVST